jgi:hypothetical protein
MGAIAFIKDTEACFYQPKTWFSGFVVAKSGEDRFPVSKFQAFLSGRRRNRSLISMLGNMPS